MNSERSGLTLIDYVAILISPILIMMMVGSLVFFLIEVLYRGNYSDRMLYTFFFFVIGCVLIARISIEMGRARAGIYAAGLGGACFVAMMAFVDYPTGIMKALGPIINIGLMALVWWSAHKLTWDCTHLDEDRTTSGRGVLSAAGLEENKEAPPEPEPEIEVKKGKKKQPKKEGFDGWLDRYQKYRAEQKKKSHTLGVWVLYFSLAALPLFALGQSLIAADDSARRTATFLQMAVYVGSGLALLVTTSLMGLRKYLEDRGAKVPTVLTAGWLGLGGGLILLFLFFGALLPRPHSETPMFGMKQAGQGNRKASKNAVVKDKSSGKGEGTAGEKTTAGQGKNSAKGGQPGGNKGEKGSGNNKGDSKGGNQKGGDKSGNSGEQKGNSNSDQAKSKNQDQSKSNSKDEKSDGDQSKSPDGDQSNNEGDQAEDADGDQSSSDSSSSSNSPVSAVFEAIGNFVKWIVWIVIALAIIVGVVVFFLKWLSPFTKWARDMLDWLKGLWGRKPGDPNTQVSTSVEEQEAEFRPPFSAFPNPFSDGTARDKSPAELVEYTFEAFDAWAWERDLGRAPGETPMEFAVRIGHEFPEIDEPGFATAELLAKTIYSNKPLPKNTPEQLEALWDQLEAVSQRPLSRRDRPTG